MRRRQEQGDDLSLHTVKKNTAVAKILERDEPQVAQELLDDHLAGMSVAESAAKRGMGASAGYALLLRHVEQGFKEAQASKALEALESAEEDMANEECDMLQLARARERARAAQWKLERLKRNIYGVDVPSGIGTTVIFQIPNLRGEQGARVIEAPRSDPAADRE